MLILCDVILETTRGREKGNSEREGLEYHCNSSPLSLSIIALFYKRSREYFMLALLIYSSSSPVFLNHTCHMVSLKFQCV